MCLELKNIFFVLPAFLHNKQIFFFFFKCKTLTLAATHRIQCFGSHVTVILKVGELRPERNMVSPFSAPDIFICFPCVLLLKNTKKFSQTCKRTKMSGTERKRSLCRFSQNHVYFSRSSSTLRITVTQNNRNTQECVAFRSFLVEIKVFWKY